MSHNTVPDIVVGRLPIYLRVLNHLIAEGRQITSSQELGDRLGISSAQIRKDLSHFGEFGKQGTGYNVAYLRDQLTDILNVDREWRMVLIGAGDLGHALVHYHRFSEHGFHIVAVFDNDADKIGTKLGEFDIHSIDEMEAIVRAEQVEMAIIAVPVAAARDVANRLINLGITAILSYAPVTLTVPVGVQVQYIDPVAQLQHMAYYQSVEAS